VNKFAAVAGILTFVCLALLLDIRAQQSKENSTAAPKGGKTAMLHPVVHFEIGCRDTQKTQDFYTKMFGWKIEQAGPAALIDTGEGIGGHISSLGHEPNFYTIFYVQVEDVQAYLDKAKSLGGKALVPPIEIPTGTLAWMQDPEGNTVGLWKSANK
jgi:uncharacterized protein